MKKIIDPCKFFFVLQQIEMQYSLAVSHKLIVYTVKWSLLQMWYSVYYVRIPWTTPPTPLPELS